MWPEIRERVCNIVFSQEMAPDPEAVTGAFPNLNTVGVMMGDNRQIPEWAFRLLTNRRKRDIEDWIRLELLETGHNLQVEGNGKRMPPVFDPVTTGPEGAPIRYQIPKKGYGFKYELYRMPREETHDRGRYIFNSFHKDGDCYYQGRRTAEEAVYVVELLSKSLRRY